MRLLPLDRDRTSCGTTDRDRRGGCAALVLANAFGPEGFVVEQKARPGRCCGRRKRRAHDRECDVKLHDASPLLVHTTLGKSGHRAWHWSLMLAARLRGQSTVNPASHDDRAVAAMLVNQPVQEIRPHFEHSTRTTASLPTKSPKVVPVGRGRGGHCGS